MRNIHRLDSFFYKSRLETGQQKRNIGERREELGKNCGEEGVGRESTRDGYDSRG